MRLGGNLALCAASSHDSTRLSEQIYSTSLGPRDPDQLCCIGFILVVRFPRPFFAAASWHLIDTVALVGHVPLRFSPPFLDRWQSRCPPCGCAGPQPGCDHNAGVGRGYSALASLPNQVRPAVRPGEIRFILCELRDAEWRLASGMTEAATAHVPTSLVWDWNFCVALIWHTWSINMLREACVGDTATCMRVLCCSCSAASLMCATLQGRVTPYRVQVVYVQICAAADV